jgi:hypothetical protein
MGIPTMGTFLRAISQLCLHFGARAIPAGILAWLWDTESPLEYYICYTVVMSAQTPKTQPFSIRLGVQANTLVSDEVRRSGRSRSVVVEELAEEAAKARLFPGIAFRGRPRRAWVIGSGLDVWEIVELLRSYRGDEGSLLADHPLLGVRALRAARAYAERFSEEIDGLIEENQRPLSELRELYPFLQVGSSR